MKFKIGDIVKCIRCDYTKEFIGKYFIVKRFTFNYNDIILETDSIDIRLPDRDVGLFQFKFEKVSKEDYIILKLKGIINTKGISYNELS